MRQVVDVAVSGVGTGEEIEVAGGNDVRSLIVVGTQTEHLLKEALALILLLEGILGGTGVHAADVVLSFTMGSPWRVVSEGREGEGREE